MDHESHLPPTADNPEVLSSSGTPSANTWWLVGLALIGLTTGITVWFFFFSPLRAPAGFAGLIDTHPSSSPTASVPSPSPVRSTPTPRPVVEVPQSAHLSGGTHTYQTFNNCGPAALSMTLSHYGITENQQVLGQALRPYQQSRGDNDDKSVTLQEIAAKSAEYGFQTYQRPAGTIAQVEAFIAAGIPVITRTWLSPNEDIGHFRVITGYDRNRNILIQDDSLQGRNLEYSYDAFNELWEAFNFEFLVLVPTEKQAAAEQILGELLNEDDAWKKAKQLAETKLNTQPNDTYALFNLSVAHYQLGEYADSARVYEQVAPQLPFRMLWYQLEPLLAYYQLHNYDRFLSIADSILNNQNRAYSELHYLKGLILQQRNQNEAAQAAFQAATQYNASEYWKENLP